MLVTYPRVALRLCGDPCPFEGRDLFLLMMAKIVRL